MESYKNKLVFKIYSAALATHLHYSILENTANVDKPNAPDIYIRKIRNYAKNLKHETNMKNFISLYSNIYNMHFAERKEPIRQIKEFINSWYSINKKNNTGVNTHLSTILYKINVNVTNKLIQDYFPGMAETHIKMFLASNNPKYKNEVAKFESQYNNIVLNTLAISCYNFNNAIKHDNQLTTVPIESYMSVVRELEVLKKQNNKQLIDDLKAENIRLKNKIEMLELEKHTIPHTISQTIPQKEFNDEDEEELIL